MQDEGVGKETGTQVGTPSKMKTALRVMRLFLFGLGMAAVFGDLLLEQRYPHSPWTGTIYLVVGIIGFLDLFRKKEAKRFEGLNGYGFALFLCLIPLYYLRDHVWTPVVAGALLAAFFWSLLKAGKRPYQFVPAGCFLSGLLSLQFPWPNEQRSLLTLVGVGITISLQGLWIIVRYLQGDRPAYLQESEMSSKESSGRGLMRIIHLLFGPIGHVQTFSSEFEQRIQTRYQSEIGQLRDLGFCCAFSDGETFSLFRLALVLPCIAVIGAFCQREVLTIHEGTKFLSGYPVLISRDKTCFAQSCGLGSKFYTVFQDGTLLVSKAYDDGNMGHGPTIVKFAQKASIADTWASHQSRIQALEAEGKRVDRQTSFESYAEMSHRETAAW